MYYSHSPIFCSLLVFSGFAILLCPTVSHSSDPDPAIRKAAEGGEIHGVGVFAPAIWEIELKDWPGLIDSLRRRKGSAVRVWECLSEETRKLASQEDILTKIYALEQVPPDPRRLIAREALKLRALLKSDFGNLLDRPDLYQEEAFKGTVLGQEVKDLLALGDKRTALQTARMNWGLLAASFPTCVPDLSSRFRTVRIRVREGKNVVLVVSANTMCRWEVDIERGAKVTGVILCGNHAQEISGVGDAPVAYRASHQPDGKRIEGHNHLYGYDKLDLSFQKLVAGVKRLTGKGFSSFQGEYQPKSEPYIVPPSGDE